MKRVGIVTCHRSCNPGAQLQGYALKTILQRNGYNTSMIDHPLNATDLSRPPFPIQYIREAPNLLVYFKRIMTTTLYYVYYKFKHKKMYTKYERFLMENDAINIKENVTLEQANEHCSGMDVVVCGSDQIWNYAYGKRFKPLFFAASFEGPRKIAYAGSAGSNEEIPSDKIAEFSALLANFDHLSCRETETTALINTLLPNSHCKTVLDPALLLTAEDYQAVYAQPVKVPKKAYIFVYYAWRDDALTHRIEELSKTFNLDVFSYRGGDKNIGPREFAWLVAHAKMVITNSYHATIFALLFHRPLTATKPAVGYMRIEDLLKRLGIENCYVPDTANYGNLTVADTIDYNKVDPVLNSLRQDSINWLLHAVSGE